HRGEGARLSTRTGGRFAFPGGGGAGASPGLRAGSRARERKPAERRFLARGEGLHRAARASRPLLHRGDGNGRRPRLARKSPAAPPRDPLPLRQGGGLRPDGSAEGGGVMRRGLVWLALLCAACAQEIDEGDPLPEGRFHYPTGVTLTPELEGLPQRLLVVSSNTDLRYRAGRVHAFDAAALDALVDGATGGCEGADCPVVEIFDLEPALVGSVEIGSLAGEIAATALDGAGLPPVRAFVPIRGTRTVVAVDLDAAGIRCAELDGDCREGGAGFAREDPFVVVAHLGTVFVGHVTLFRDRTGALGFASAAADFWRTGGGALTAIALGPTAVGGLAAGNCREEGGEQTCTVYVNGRSGGDAQRLFALDFSANAVLESPLFSRNVGPLQRGADSRGIAVSPARERAYLAQRNPDALAIVDVSRMPELPSD